MSRIPGHVIDQILQTARIEEVIGEFVQLKRAGTNLKGLSPFTDERTPSFIVSPGKQIFKCFSTGKGGNVVSFLMEKEHFSYPEALKWLADKYNIEVPQSQEVSAEELAIATEKDSLFIINEFAKNHFHENLTQTQEGTSIGLSYFEERGFRRDIIEKFQLGYCANSGTDFTDSALAKGFKFDYLEKVGLSKEKEGRRFDFFRGRVMFPIQSLSGRVLGFGGRTLFTDKKVAKYFNSPESPVYNKSEVLYGMFFAKNSAIKYDECLLCEGYTDVISMHQAGIENVVSSSGTSLTREQIRLISRFTKNITILFDGDAAGIKASFRGIDLILEEGLNVKVVLFPEGEDPDSYSKKTSSTDLIAFLKANKQDFISFKAGILLKDAHADPLQKAQLIKDIVLSISLIPDAITRTVYAQEIASKYAIEVSLINEEVSRHRKGKLAEALKEPWIADVKTAPKPIPQLDAPKAAVLQSELIEKELMRLMLQYGSREMVFVKENVIEPMTLRVTDFIIQELASDDLSFVHPVCAKIYGEMLDGIAEGILYTANYFNRSQDMEIIQFVTDLETLGNELSPNWESKYRITTKHEEHDIYPTVLYAIYNFKYHKICDHIEGLRNKIQDESIEEAILMELLSEQMAYERVKIAFSEKLGRIILK